MKGNNSKLILKIIVPYHAQTLNRQRETGNYPAMLGLLILLYSALSMHKIKHNISVTQNLGYIFSVGWPIGRKSVAAESVALEPVAAEQLALKTRIINFPSHIFICVCQIFFNFRHKFFFHTPKFRQNFPSQNSICIFLCTWFYTKQNSLISIIYFYATEFQSRLCTKFNFNSYFRIQFSPFSFIYQNSIAHFHIQWKSAIARLKGPSF